MRKRRVILLLSQSSMVARLLPVFHDAGLPVVALAPRRDPIRRSRLIERFVPVPDDPEGRAAAWGRWAERADPTDWFVPGSDDVLWAILDSGLPADLKMRLLPVGDEKALLALDSKGEMARARSEAGVLQPDWARTEDAGEVPELAARIGYPVIVKQGRSRAGGGVQVLRSPGEQLRLDSSPRTRGLLVERFLEGPDVSVECLFLTGQLVALTTSRSLASLGQFGVSVAREFEDCTDAALVRDLESLGTQLGLDGFANVSARSDARGRHWVFEVDVRPNVWHAYLPGVGVDLAAALQQGGSAGVRGLSLDASPVVVRNLSRSVIHAASPRGVRTVPRLVRHETLGHVHTGDWGLLPGDLARVGGRLLRHVRQGVAGRLG